MLVRLIKAVKKEYISIFDYVAELLIWYFPNMYASTLAVRSRHFHVNVKLCKSFKMSNSILQRNPVKKCKNTAETQSPKVSFVTIAFLLLLLLVFHYCVLFYFLQLFFLSPYSFNCLKKVKRYN